MNLTKNANVENSINSFFGEDLQKISQVNQFQEALFLQKENIENRLDHANSSISEELQDLLNSGDELDGKVKKLAAQHDKLLNSSREASTECRKFAEDNQQILSDIVCVRGVTQYTLWLRMIEQVNLDLSVSIDTKDKSQIILAYQKLLEVRDALNGSKCRNLYDYVEMTVKHWYGVLCEKYTTALQSSLNLFGWPFIQSSEGKSAVDDRKKFAADDINVLQDSIEVLLRIQDTNVENVDKSYMNMPMKILLKSLKTRFKFHFLGNKSTNNPAKPEWYTTQLSTWALMHRQFLSEYVQPVYDREEKPILAIMEFAQGLVAFAVDKLSIDIPIVMEDDFLFAHTIDEIIGFSREMSNLMKYSPSQPSVLQPLTCHAVFTRFL